MIEISQETVNKVSINLFKGMGKNCPVPFYPMNIKGGKFITKLTRPKTDERPIRISFLNYTHMLTSQSPTRPNMDRVRRFVAYNQVTGINEGDYGTDDRIGGNNTPLMHAALYGFDELVLYYLELGANPFTANINGLMAIDMARRHVHMKHPQYQRIVDILENAAKDRRPIR